MMLTTTTTTTRQRAKSKTKRWYLRLDYYVVLLTLACLLHNCRQAFVLLKPSSELIDNATARRSLFLTEWLASWAGPTTTSSFSNNATAAITTTVATRTSTITPTVPTLLKEELKSMGIIEYVVYRNDHPGQEEALDRSSDSTQLPVTVLVHHREFYGGCHSFERFLNKRWETMFVLSDDLVDALHLKDLAQQAVINDQSAGVHFAILDHRETTISGEWFGRKVYFHLQNFVRTARGGGVSSRTSPPPPPVMKATPLLLSTHCDIQPLPEWHALHKPYELTVEKMVNEFLDEDRVNQMNGPGKKETNVNDVRHNFPSIPMDPSSCDDTIKDKRRPLLVLNTVMVETLPSADTLKGSRFHSEQTGLSIPWEKQWKRTSEDGKAWMSDITTWVEDHFALYNATLLESIVEPLSYVHNSVSAGPKIFPLLMCRNNWKAVRLNDEPMFYDFAKVQHQSITDDGTKRYNLFNASKYGPDLDLDWFFHRAIRDIVNVSSPIGCQREIMRLRTIPTKMTNANSSSGSSVATGNKGGVRNKNNILDIDVKPACIISNLHWQSNHVPNYVWENPVCHDQATMDMAIALMRVQGYELLLMEPEMEPPLRQLATFPAAVDPSRNWRDQLEHEHQRLRMKNDTLTFVNIPSHFTQSRHEMIKRLSPSIPGLETGQLESGRESNEFVIEHHKYIQIPCSTILHKEAFFSTRSLKLAISWNAKPGRDSTSIVAQRMCDIASSTEEFLHDAVKKIWEPLTENCVDGMNWEDHACVLANRKRTAKCRMKDAEGLGMNQLSS